MITGGLHPEVLRLLAAEGMVSLGLLSLDGTKVADNAAQKAHRTLAQIEKILAEAAGRDATEDARCGDVLCEPTPRALARAVERRERLARARDRLAAKTRRAAGRSGTGSKPGTRPRRPGKLAAGTVPAMSNLRPAGLI